MEQEDIKSTSSVSTYSKGGEEDDEQGSKGFSLLVITVDIKEQKDRFKTQKDN